MLAALGKVLLLADAGSNTTGMVIVSSNLKVRSLKDRSLRAVSKDQQTATSRGGGRQRHQGR